MARRDNDCAVLYHFWSSSGGFAVTESFNVVAVSTLLRMRIRLSSSRLYFSLNSFPSAVRAVISSLCDLRPCETSIVVSGRNTISFSKARLLRGSCFLRSSVSCCCFFQRATASSGFFPAFTASARTFCISRCWRCSSSFFCCCSRLRCCNDWLCIRSKRSLAFLRKGIWLYNRTKSKLPLSVSCRLLAMVLPNDIPFSRFVPRTQLYVALYVASALTQSNTGKRLIGSWYDNVKFCW